MTPDVAREIVAWSDDRRSKGPVFAALLSVDRMLQAAGVPPMSDYWKADAERFYRHPTARLLVEMVGRGGDKSRTSTKMAIAETLYGDFNIPLGERHYFTHIAENRDEAGKTMAVLEQYLRVLRVPFSRSGDTISLDGLPRGFKVLACRIGAVSGWRCIGWTADECSKWNSEGSDPSAEVIASIRAMTVTHPNARGRLFSSPLGIVGFFYDTWARGDGREQVCGHAPTWVANASVTEEQTRLLERNERKWKREYAAVPTQETDESMFSAALLDAATRKDAADIPRERYVTYVAAQDPGFVRNPWTFAIAGKRWVQTPHGPRIKRSIVCAREWQGTTDQPLNPEHVLKQEAALCRQYGVETILSDQYERYGLQTIAQRPDIRMHVHVRDHNASERLARYEAAVLQMSDGEVELPAIRQIRADLLGVVQRLTSSGFTIHLPEVGDRHCDWAPTIITALAEAVVDPSNMPEYEAPKPFTPEWEAARFDRELAQRKRVADAGGVFVDELPPWLQGGEA